MPFERIFEQLFPGRIKPTFPCREVPGGVLIPDFHYSQARAMALLLDGRDQDTDNAKFHSCTLESGDQVHGFSHIGNGARPRNQDRLLIIPDKSRILLADGLMDYGWLAADLLSIYALENFDTFEDITRDTEEKLSNILQSNQILESGGTVFALMQIQKNLENGNKRLEYCYRGDTILALNRQNSILRRTEEQTLAQMKRKNGFKTVPHDEHVVCNSINRDMDGSNRTDDPQGLDLETGDRIVIGCDGVLKGLSDQKILDLINIQIPAPTVVRNLFDSSFKGGDNITAAVIDIT